MDNKEQIQKAEQSFERAKNKLATPIASTLSKGWELEYGRSYQKLVALGVRPQIKKKFRGQ